MCQTYFRYTDYKINTQNINNTRYLNTYFFSYRGYIHHYHISIVPDKCPRKVNRDIIETMVHAYNRIFGAKKPVFDGRSNLYVREPLPIGTEVVDLEVKMTQINVS